MATAIQLAARLLQTLSYLPLQSRRSRLKMDLWWQGRAPALPSTHEENLARRIRSWLLFRHLRD